MFHENAFIAGRKGSTSRDRLPMFTPLMFAALGGHIDAARALLAAGANPNDTTPTGVPVLHIACINAHWEFAMMLLDHGVDPNVESPGGTALHHVGHVRAAKALVRVGGLPPPDPTDTKTSLDLAKALIARGANVNAPLTKLGIKSYGTIFGGHGRGGQKVGMTPIMLTVSPNDPAYMQLLLDAGADPKIVTEDGTTLVMMAAGVDNTALLGDDEEALANIKTLVERGVDVNAQNKLGDTALHAAASRNYIPLIEYLIERGAGIETKNQIGWTPQMEAMWTVRGFLNTRPEADAFFRKLYTERGLTPVILTRQEAVERLAESRGFPVIKCPEGVTVKTTDRRPVVIDYPQATATTRRGYAKLDAKCTPASGSEFPFGTTPVTCTTKDANNRTDSCTVLMQVVESEDRRQKTGDRSRDALCSRTRSSVLCLLSSDY